MSQISWYMDWKNISEAVIKIRIRNYKDIDFFVLVISILKQVDLRKRTVLPNENDGAFKIVLL